MTGFFRPLLLAMLVFAAAPAWAAFVTDPPPVSEIEAPAAGSIEATPAAREDERIESRLQDIFANVPSLARVEVTVIKGVVILSGMAPDEEAAARAQAIAGGVKGVVTIENAIARDVSVELSDKVDGLQELLNGFVQMLPLIGAAMIVALAIAAFGHLLASLTGLWRRLAPNSSLAELIASAIRFAFVMLAAVVALDMIGAGALLGAVLGGAGVIGIALGFAMRDTVENYVASLMLSVRQPFRANDHIVIDAYEGHVIRLTSRATVLMTLDGNHLRIPNSTVFKAVILNYTRNPQRRFEFALGIDADDDALEACALGRRTLCELPFILDEPEPAVFIDEVGDSNVSLKFLAWVDQREADFAKARSRTIAAAKQALEAAGFVLPEPIYRLRLDQRTVPLPFENIAARRSAPKNAAGQSTDAPQPGSPPSPLRPVAPDEADVSPAIQIKRMVDEERAGPEKEADLLDPERPVE